MSFKPTDLSVLAYANNFTLWHYITEDADVTAGGYFNKASDMLRVNDLMIANTDVENEAGGTTVFYVITGNTGGVVTIEAYTMPEEEV
ncbi:MAG: hypothetical protein ACK4VI_01130 [Alphaproteobacteria bacterium]